jgi:hypothetical protein
MSLRASPPKWLAPWARLLMSLLFRVAFVARYLCLRDSGEGLLLRRPLQMIELWRGLFRATSTAVFSW